MQLQKILHSLHHYLALGELIASFKGIPQLFERVVLNAHIDMFFLQ